MLKMDMKMKISMMSVVLFLLIGYDKTYEQTNKLFGSLVKQKDAASYGMGENYKQYGFLIHALVVGIITYLVLQYYFKI